MSIQQDYVPESDVLALLREHPNGLTVRQVAEEFDTSYIAAQNALRVLFMEDKAEYTRPKRINENKRWKAIPEESR